jgi:hypothetical protein
MDIAEKWASEDDAGRFFDSMGIGGDARSGRV